MALLVGDSSDIRFELVFLGWEYYPVDERGEIPERLELWDSMPFVVFSKDWIQYEARIVHYDTVFANRATMDVNYDLCPLLTGLRLVAKGRRDRWCFEPMEPAFRLIFGLPDVRWRSTLERVRGARRKQTKIVDVFAEVDSEFYITGSTYGGEGIGVHLFVTGQQLREFRDALQRELDGLGSPPDGIIRKEEIVKEKK